VMAKAKGPYLGCLGLAAMWLAPLTLSGLDFGLGLIREGDWKERGAALAVPAIGRADSNQPICTAENRKFPLTRSAGGI
jgi:hypothetical protein